MSKIPCPQPDCGGNVRVTERVLIIDPERDIASRFASRKELHQWMRVGLLIAPALVVIAPIVRGMLGLLLALLGIQLLVIILIIWVRLGRRASENNAIIRRYECERCHYTWYLYGSTLERTAQWLENRVLQPDVESNRALLADLQGDRAMIALYLNDPARARELGEQALTLQRERAEPRGTARVLHYLGLAALLEERLDEAMERLGESLSLYQSVDDGLGIAQVQSSLGLCALAGGEPARAASLLDESLPRLVAHRDERTIALNLAGRAELAAQAGRPHLGAELAGQLAWLTGSIGWPLLPPLEAAQATRRAALQEQLGPQGYQAAWERGQQRKAEGVGPGDG